MKKIIVGVILMLLSLSAIMAQKDISHLKAFAKTYGYVKYFHPSTESTKIDWDAFSAYGVSKILACESSQDFLDRI